MKAVIKYGAPGSESFWKKGDDGKHSTFATVTGEDNNQYRVRFTEGTPQWTAMPGESVEIEVKDLPADGKPGYAFIAGQAPQKKFGGGGGNFAPRKTYTVEEVGKTAIIAARLAAHTYCTLHAALEEKGQTDSTAEDVRTMTNTIIIELMKRLP